MYQEEENELDALQSAKELEEEKKRAKEQQAKLVRWQFNLSQLCVICVMFAGWHRPGYLYDCYNVADLCRGLCQGNATTIATEILHIYTFLDSKYFLTFFVKK